MWLQGVLVIHEDDHGMMGPTCLEHCLSAIRVDDANDGFVVATISLPVPQIIESSFPVSFSWGIPRIESHHDPSQILTTILRE